MIGTDKKYLMFIEPASKKQEPTVDDELSAYADILMNKMRPRNDFTKGFHVCKCGKAHSASHTFSVSLAGKSYITNNLLAHYVKNHRSEIPDLEMIKLQTGLEHYRKTNPDFAAKWSGKYVEPYVSTDFNL